METLLPSRSRRASEPLYRPSSMSSDCSAMRGRSLRTLSFEEIECHTADEIREEDGDLLMNQVFAVRPAFSDGVAPRLLDRQSHFHQSRGRLKIKRTHCRAMSSLKWADPFHSLVVVESYWLFFFVSCLIMSSWIVFSALFLWVSNRCHAECNSFVKALYLAMETIETIGYGVPDSNFHSCYEALFVLAGAALWETLLNAIMISLVYTRISRPQARASSICFTEKAIITKLDDAWYFMFQVCDFRKHQLCEAHIRLYCIQHAQTSEGVDFQTTTMRLQHPDDELGSMLLPALPQLIVHRIDPWSPLCPKECQTCDGSTPEFSFEFPQIPQRAADAESGDRCSGATRVPQPEAPSLATISKHLANAKLEVVCFLEGSEPGSSSCLQARHSYSYDDIVYNAAFKKCVSRLDDGTCQINFDEFHEIVDAEFGHIFGVQSII